MAEKRLHWRIAYSLSEFYYVIASSDVPKNDLVESWADLAGGYTTTNGMASILSRSPNARYEGLVPHLFIRGGNAHEAMEKMIKKLDEINDYRQHYIARL
jgi:hypothetical protein